MDELTLHDSGWDRRIIEQFMSEFEDQNRAAIRDSKLIESDLTLALTLPKKL